MRRRGKYIWQKYRKKTSSDKHCTSEIISKPDSQVVSQSILCNAQLSNIYQKTALLCTTYVRSSKLQNASLLVHIKAKMQAFFNKPLWVHHFHTAPSSFQTVDFILAHNFSKILFFYEISFKQKSLTDYHFKQVIYSDGQLFLSGILLFSMII